MQRIRRWVLPFLLAILGVPGLAGCDRAVTPSEWTGVVTLELTDQGSGNYFMASVLTVPESGRYILLFDPELMTVGVTDNGGSIAWELGRRYRIRGESVTDTRELEAAAQIGFSQIIRANYIELLSVQSE
jgi:hypothetical protein